MEPTRFLRFDQILKVTGLSKSTVNRLERLGEFPRRKKLSASAIGWVESEVRDWVLKRCEAGGIKSTISIY